MRNRIDRAQLREGMQVYSGEGQRLGPIERLDADSVTVNGQQYKFTSIERLEGDRVYLTRQVGASVDLPGGSSASTRSGAVGAEGAARVPVREERLQVEKRPAELGEVQVRKEVVTEQQTVPVELEREEVRVEQRDVPERPVETGQRPFEEDTIRVPVRGEQPVVTKEAVVTGEVVINKERTTETQQVTDTVRKERVDVDEDYARHRAAYEQEYANRQGAAGTTFADAEPHFRTGYRAAVEEGNATRSWDEVEPELRERYRGEGGESAWERVKREVREGFDRARQR